MSAGLVLDFKNKILMMILLFLLSHNNLVSFYRNTIRKDKLCDRCCITVKISQHNMANA